MSENLDSSGQHHPPVSQDSPASFSNSPQPSAHVSSKSSKIKTSLKGFASAKKRLRAFSIQKKNPVQPTLTKVHATLPKVASTGNPTTVLIGKLCNAKVTPKLPPPEVMDFEKKPPKPPKPGTCDSYMDLQNRTMAEIEDMKRRMEMVELGIPLGVICPSPHNKLTPSKAMPTKAMPPIQVLEVPPPKVPVMRKSRKKKHPIPENVVTTSEPEKIDEIIREAKKAKEEGREFKFEYRKFVPGYENPFQWRQRERSKEGDKSNDAAEKKDLKYDRSHSHSSKSDRDRYIDRKSSRHEVRKYLEPRGQSDSRGESKKVDRDKQKDKTRERDKERNKDRNKDKSKSKDTDKTKAKEEKKPKKIGTDTKKIDVKSEKSDAKETDLNLNEYLVCDSWSLENEDKTDSPNVAGSLKVDNLKKVEGKKVGNSKKGNIENADICKKDDDESRKVNMQADQKIIKKVAAAKEEIDNYFKDPMQIFRESLLKKKRLTAQQEYPVLPKLKPVVDSFTYEIDPEDATLDMFAQSDKLMKKPKKDFDQESQTSKDVSADDDFLESVITEIKQENMSDDETSHDKGLVEYDMSPERSPEEARKPSPPLKTKKDKEKSDSTPERKEETSSQRSDISDSGFKSIESGYKSVESDYKSTASDYKSTGSVPSPDSYNLEEVEKELDEAMDRVSKATLDSLDTWSFVMKICQPLLFRHDRNKCYKETQAVPRMWYTENPKLCDCVKDRSIVYEELDACKMMQVDRVYGCEQMEVAPFAKVRNWYPKLDECLIHTKIVEAAADWEMEEPNEKKEPSTPSKVQSEEKRESRGKKQSRGKRAAPSHTDDISLDREYQRFMDAVWPEITEPKDSRSTTPTKDDAKKKKKKAEDKEERKKAKKMKLAENLNVELGTEKGVEKSKKSKMEKKEEKSRKRKRSSSTISESTDQGDDDKKNKKKLAKKKTDKKNKLKSIKHLKLEKKYLKKLKEKQKKRAKKLKEKAEKIEVESEEEKEAEKPKKSKKKKQQKLKKKIHKKKKAPSPSSSESSSDSETDSESLSEKENKTKKKNKKKDDAEKSKKKKKKDKKRKRKQSISESTQSDDLFDVNILNNIKTEKVDAEVAKKVEEIQEFSPRRQEVQRKEIINMNDFVTHNNIHIKQEVVETPAEEIPSVVEEVAERLEVEPQKESPVIEPPSPEKKSPEFKEPQDKPQPIRSVTEESNLSQSSSQESVCSVKEPSYEKDDSHLRPSSQNSNYSFNDVIASQTIFYSKMDESDVREDYQNYEMYERLAMEYQSGVANLQTSEPTSEEFLVTNQIETVVSRGEIKCDWRAGDKVQRAPPRPSRWGLKPGDANIVLTGTGPSEDSVYQIRSVLEQNTYRIESITGHGNDSATDYDEAYADMYAASDRIQYGDCFTEPSTSKPPEPPSRPSLDARIEKVLCDAAKQEKKKAEEIEKTNVVIKPKTMKRVSFADGYKPGQDSDTEAPPAKKKKRLKRTGCAWPCPATHPDHVALWDALPPPPPPPGSPPPPHTSLPPLHLLRPPPHCRDQLIPPLHHQGLPGFKFDPPGAMPNMLPPEPPPGMLNLQHMQM